MDTLYIITCNFTSLRLLWASAVMFVFSRKHTNTTRKTFAGAVCRRCMNMNTHFPFVHKMAFLVLSPHQSAPRTAASSTYALTNALARARITTMGNISGQSTLRPQFGEPMRCAN